MEKLLAAYMLSCFINAKQVTQLWFFLRASSTFTIARETTAAITTAKEVDKEPYCSRSKSAHHDRLSGRLKVTRQNRLRTESAPALLMAEPKRRMRMLFSISDGHLNGELCLAFKKTIFKAVRTHCRLAFVRSR